MSSAGITKNECLTTYENVSDSRWIMGGIGTVLIVSAVAFAIIATIQPDGFVQGVGIVGNPHSWALWTIVGPACIIGGVLIACAICSRNKIKKNVEKILEKEIVPVAADQTIEPVTADKAIEEIREFSKEDLDRLGFKKLEKDHQNYSLYAALPNDFKMRFRAKFHILYKTDDQLYVREAASRRERDLVWNDAAFKQISVPLSVNKSEKFTEWVEMAQKITFQKSENIAWDACIPYGTFYSQYDNMTDTHLIAVKLFNDSTVIGSLAGRAFVDMQGVFGFAGYYSLSTQWTNGDLTTELDHDGLQEMQNSLLQEVADAQKRVLSSIIFDESVEQAEGLSAEELIQFGFQKLDRDHECHTTHRFMRDQSWMSCDSNVFYRIGNQFYLKVVASEEEKEKIKGFLREQYPASWAQLQKLNDLFKEAENVKFKDARNIQLNARIPPNTLYYHVIPRTSTYQMSIKLPDGSTITQQVGSELHMRMKNSLTYSGYRDLCAMWDEGLFAKGLDNDDFDKIIASLLQEARKISQR